jgi:hypothetical protein
MVRYAFPAIRSLSHLVNKHLVDHGALNLAC